MASVGPQSPTVSASSVLQPFGGVWSNTNSAFASDDARATVNLNSAPNTDSRDILLTGFDFSAIPSGATIDGIVVEIERSCTSTSGSPHDGRVQLRKTGAVVGTNKASATTWPTTDAYASYGGASDLWGTTWTLAEIQASTFGVDIYVSGSGVKWATTVRIDHVRITVYYTAGGGGGTVGRIVTINQAVRRASTF